MKKERLLRVIAAFLKISAGLAIVLGILTYRNLSICLPLVCCGVAILPLGMLIENIAARLTYINQYLVQNDRFLINKVYNSGAEHNVLSERLSAISIGEAVFDGDYVVYNVSTDNENFDVKSNKYLYALLRSGKNVISG